MVMDRFSEQPYYSYSWHQSHDQATVLLMIPNETPREDIVVVIEQNYLIVGVRGRPPTVKGRLYANVDTASSVWQLEPREHRLSARERTTSTTSTTSTQSSYAFVSDPEISSSFAASLESAQVSEAEDLVSSPALSSPTLSSADERALPLPPLRPRSVRGHSRSTSPGHAFRSVASSYSSLESLHPQSGRLLTLHLEKEQSIIWPSLIVGPVPETISPHIASSVVFISSPDLENKYNMDPTSLALTGLELLDIRKDKEEAFEFFLRSWHQARVPSATMRLVTHYLPTSTAADIKIPEEPAPKGTNEYNAQCLGGSRGLAQLYLEAGLLHLEGTASSLSASYSSLSSIRMPLQSHPVEGGTAAWNRDREEAARYFEHAKLLQPDLEIPPLPLAPQDAGEELEMPTMDVGSSAPPSLRSEDSSHYMEPDTPLVRKRRKKEELSLFNDPVSTDDMEGSWLFQIPGLVGAGTALLVFGIVGALSFSTWSRRNQGS